ncbi:MAG TPA: cytochrome c [Gammaproteobacteria bacterium]|nr:cytochrome c [Gammaproteobacteria bacterium]
MARLSLVVAAAFALLAADAVLAATPKDAVSYRQDVMKSMAGHVGAIGEIVKGQVDYDHIVAQAKALADTAPLVKDIFPENSKPSDYSKTQALAKIWQQPQDFQKKVSGLENAAQAFLASAQSGDKEKIQASFKEVGQACGSCHKEFRAKKK